MKGRRLYQEAVNYSFTRGAPLMKTLNELPGLSKMEVNLLILANFGCPTLLMFEKEENNFTKLKIVL